MDEQFSPSDRAQSWSYIKLKKPLKALFFFRGSSTRHRFLTAAVIQQCVAYAYLLLSVIWLLLEVDRGVNDIDMTNCFILADVAYVVAAGLFYRFYR